MYRDDSMINCAECAVGEEPNTDKTDCEKCPAGSYKDDEMIKCEECSDNEISAEDGATSCTTCVDADEEPNLEKTACVTYCPELNINTIPHILLVTPRKPPGTEVTIRCNAGYALQGNRILSCSDVGSWGGLPSSCELCETLSTNSVVKEERKEVTGENSLTGT
ncbi:clotting factor C-like [Bolinopsis microptera]|uniref:clotting factor C-like n=1 Tax=Bolinopsis microptera TaxID=2820187 RepID=UPI00307B02AE